MVGKSLGYNGGPPWGSSQPGSLADNSMCRVLLSGLRTGDGETILNVAPAWSHVVREGFLEEADR